MNKKMDVNLFRMSQLEMKVAQLEEAVDQLTKIAVNNVSNLSSLTDILEKITDRVIDK